MAHKYEFVSTGNGFSVENDGVKTTVIEQDGTINVSDITAVDFTATGDVQIGNAAGDTLDLQAITTVATTQKIQFRDTGIYLNSSVDGQLDIVADTEVQLASPKFDLNGVLDVEDTTAGGASNGSVIKKTLQAGEAYTGTTAGLMVKNYGDATATVPSGEFTGLYVSLKGLHTDPGHNTSLISAHVHGDNTTTVHTGLWLYGDMTNGVKASGSTLTSMIDISEATAVTNLADLPAAATDTVLEANTGTPGACNYIIRFATQTSTPLYVPAYTSKPS